MDNLNINEVELLESDYDYIENEIDSMGDDLNNCKELVKADVKNIEAYTSKTEKLKYVLENGPQIVNSVSELSSNVISGINGIVQSFQNYNIRKKEIEAHILLISKQIDCDIEKRRSIYIEMKKQLDNIRESSNRILEEALSIDNINSPDRLFELKQKLIEQSTACLSEATKLIIEYLSK